MTSAATTAAMRAICQGIITGEHLAATGLGQVLEAAVLSKTVCLLAGSVDDPDDQLPRRATRFLATTLRSNRHKTRVYRAEATRVTSAFAEAGVRVAVGGGVAVADTLYGGSGARQFSDLDLLVDDPQTAHEVLTKIGYQHRDADQWGRAVVDPLLDYVRVDIAAPAETGWLDRRDCRLGADETAPSAPSLAVSDELTRCLVRIARATVTPWALFADALRLHQALGGAGACPMPDGAAVGWRRLRSHWPHLPGREGEQS